MGNDSRSPVLEGSVDSVVARTPVLLVIDADGAMGSITEDADGNRRPQIEQLNAGLQEFKRALSDDFKTASRTDISVVTFGGDVTIEHEFTNVDHWDPPTLSAAGATPMAQALCEGLSHLEAYRNELQAAKIPYRPAFVWLVTGATPTDTVGPRWEAVQESVNDGTRNEIFWLYTSSIGSQTEIDALAELRSAASDSEKARALRSESGDIQSYFSKAAEALRHQINGYTASARVRHDAGDVADDGQGS